MHRRRKQSGRRFERSERVCDKRSLSCPLSENRRPIPTEVPCGHFWSHLLVTKGGKTTSSQRTYRPQAGTTAREKRGKSDGGDTCAFSPCLTFRYFWVKPKVRRKLLPALACTKTGQLVSQAATCREIQYSLRPAETKAMIFRAVGSRIGFALRIPPRNDKTSAILRSFCREY